MQELGKLLIEKNISIASVESFTVGSFASAIGSVPGISKVYRGSMVTYQSEMKHKLLNIDQEIIDTIGVVSKEVALMMAEAGKRIFECDLCISFTGNSGPLPMEGKPVGLCYMAIAYKDATNVYTLHLNGDREQIKNQGVQEGIKYLKQLIQN